MAIPSIFYGWDDDPDFDDGRFEDEPNEDYEVVIEYPARKPVISEQPDRAKEKQA